MDNNALNMAFQFDHIALDEIPQGKVNGQTKKGLNLSALKTRLIKPNSFSKGGWNSLFWSNHDQPRAVSRLWHYKPIVEKSAKMLLFTLLFNAWDTLYLSRRRIRE